MFIVSRRDFIVRHEQNRELIKQASQERLARSAHIQPLIHTDLLIKLAGWIGDLIARWSCALRGPFTAPECTLRSIP